MTRIKWRLIDTEKIEVLLLAKYLKLSSFCSFVFKLCKKSYYDPTKFFPQKFQYGFWENFFWGQTTDITTYCIYKIHKHKKETFSKILLKVITHFWQYLSSLFDSFNKNEDPYCTVPTRIFSMLTCVEKYDDCVVVVELLDSPL